MVKAPDNYQPKWIIAGQANAEAVTEELLKTREYNELPPFAQEFVQESKKVGSLYGMTTPSLSKYANAQDAENILPQLVELWGILRNIAKIVIIVTICIAIIPGFRNGLVSINPYEPLVLQLLNEIIKFAKTSLLQGSGTGTPLIYIGSPTIPISLYINFTLFLAILVSIPVTIRELMKWVKPALTTKEFEVLQTIIKASVPLFIVGCLLSFFVIMPVTLRVLASAGSLIGDGNLEVWYGLDAIINLLLWGTLGAGILYASPLILVVAVHFQFVSADHIRKRRREIFFGVLVIAAIVTPDPSLVSMIILSVPMIVIIEGVIAWCYQIEKNRILSQPFEVQNLAV